MKIKNIQFTKEVVPTYDIEVPDVHHYNCEGLVSHNSSATSNATNSIEPPRQHLSVKVSKKGTLKMIVPEYQKLKKYYTLAWDMKSNDGYIKIAGIIQKFFDQGISGNLYYNPMNFPDNQVPTSILMKDTLLCYKMGWKTRYYVNTYDMKEDNCEPISNDDFIKILNHVESRFSGVSKNTSFEQKFWSDANQDDEICEGCRL